MAPMTRKRRRSASNTAATFSPPPSFQPNITLSASAARLLRLRGSCLALGSAHHGHLAALLASLLGVQAQEHGAAALALHLRLSYTCSRDDLIAAFTTNTARSRVVRVHGARGTLHLYDAEASWPAVSAAVAGRVLAARRRSAGADALEAAVSRLDARLSKGHKVSSADLPGAEFAVRYGAMMSVTYAGRGARVNAGGATVVAPRAAVVAPADAVWEELSEDEALERVARVYFAAFAPATEADFRYYLGITAGGSTAAVARLVEAGELIALRVTADADADRFDRSLSGERLVSRVCIDGLADLEMDAASAANRTPEVIVLGRFDILALGHADKAWLVPPEMKPRVWSRNADVRALVLRSGRAIAVWRGEVRSMSREESMDEIFNSDVESEAGSGPDCRQRLIVEVELFEGVRLRRSERARIEERFLHIAKTFYQASSADVSIHAVA